MTSDDIIRAWKADEDEVNKKKNTKDQKGKKPKKNKQAPPNPAGQIELSDEDLEQIAGGPYHTCECMLDMQQ